MGVEYARYLLPRPASFRPEASVLVRLIERLREEQWLPGVATRNLAGLGGDPPTFQRAVLGMVQRKARWTTPQERRTAGLQRLPEPLTAEWLEANRDARIYWPVQPNGRIEDDEVDETLGDEDVLHMLHGIRYPLRPIEQEGDTSYYDLSIDWADDYVHPHDDDSRQTRTSTRCRCGADLARQEHGRGEPVRAPFGVSRIHASCPRCDRPFDAEQATTELRDAFDRRITRLGQGGVLHRFAIVVDCGKCFPGSPPQPAFHPEFKALCEEVLGIPLVEAWDVF